MALQEVKSIEKEKAERAGAIQRIDRGLPAAIHQFECKPTAISRRDAATDRRRAHPRPGRISTFMPKIQRIVLDRRREVFEAGGPYEWHYAEALAFGSLAARRNIPVRLSGQDSRRGTFSTRHAVIYDAKTGEPYMPLAASRREAGAHLRLQQSALGSGRARIRLRLLARLSRTCCACGRRSSAISPMARRRSSISSSSRRNQNGSGRAASSCSCRTVTKGRGRNIPARGSSDFCRPAPRTTSRSAISPRPRSIFTSCGGR